MHPDIDDYAPWADEIEWDENTTYSLSRSQDIESTSEEEHSLWVSL